MEGAGVRLKRVFGHPEVPLVDPFLLLDHFGSSNPDDYMAGFPWHPHRGIETVTYMLNGSVEHGDSIGNAGVINSGDVQWMTAGNGIIHQEMPKWYEGRMEGFQLWTNLPAADKMMNPRYRDIKHSEIPEVTIGPGSTIKVICGEVKGVKGPARDIVVDPEYLDVTLAPATEFTHHVTNGYKVFAYIIEGHGYFEPEQKTTIATEHLVIFEDGEQVTIKSCESRLRFLLISGKPIGEPVAWYGPIVMNTQQELEIAFQEYRRGTFIKYRG